MKKFVYLIAGIILIGCSQHNQQIIDEDNKTNLDWFVGNWIRTNEDPDMQTFENWKKISDHEYLGFGYTLKENDTVFQEKMEFIENEGTWILHVTMPKNPQPTSFKVTEITDSTMVCVNEKNDFPNKIHYWKDEATLKATISNQELEMLFVFEKIKK